MTRLSDDTKAPGLLWRASCLLTAAILLAVGLWLISHMTWASFGLGIWLFGKAYLKLRMSRWSLDEVWEGKTPIGFSQVLKVVGGTYIVAAVFISLARL